MVKKQFDVLCFGSLTLDIFIPLAEEGPIEIEAEKKEKFLKVPLGAKIPAKYSLIQCGGGAANTAVGFSKLGLKSATFGVLGDQSYQKFLTDELEKHNIDTSYITMAKNQSSSFSIILNSWEGERTVIHRRTVCENFNKGVLLKAPNTKAIYIGHLCTSGLLESIPEWKAKNPDAVIGWNPGSTQFKEGLEHYKPILPYIDYLFINVEEGEKFTGIDPEVHPRKDYQTELFGKEIAPYAPHYDDKICDLREMAKSLLSLGVKNLIITDGKRGAQIFNHKHHYHSPPQQVPVVDTLGAGDAFAVGVFAAQIHGKTLKESITWGSYNSASVIQKFGAQPGQLKLPEIESLAS